MIFFDLNLILKSFLHGFLDVDFFDYREHILKIKLWLYPFFEPFFEVYFLTHPEYSNVGLVLLLMTCRL